MLGRRKFLGSLTAGVAATIVPAGVVNATCFLNLREQLAELVDSEFWLKDPAGKLFEAHLVEIDIVDADPDLEQFSIVFEGDDLVEGLHRLYHPKLGSLHVGLTESGASDSVVVRQRAYFSRFA